MKKNLTDKQASILFSLIERNKIKHREVVGWAYSKFEDDGVLDWIYNITLTISLYEVKEILLIEFDIHELHTSFLLGEIAFQYENDLISYKDAAIDVWYILNDNKEWDKDEKHQANIMEDYLNWHKHPEEVVKPLLENILQKYFDEFISSINDFMNFSNFK